MKITATLILFGLCLPLAAAPLLRAAQDQQQMSTSKPKASTPAPSTPAPSTSGQKQPAKFLSGKDPDYSDSAREKHIEGTVILALTVNEKGKVKGVKVVSPLESSLDRRAVSAVKHWKFAPATLDGKPVASDFNVSLDFRLNR